MLRIEKSSIFAATRNLKLRYMRVRCVLIRLLLMLVQNTVSAQTQYMSMLQEGQTWRMEYSLSLDPSRNHLYYYDDVALAGDTIIDDIPFKRVYSRSQRSDGKDGHDWRADDEWIGEKDGRIYRYEMFWSAYYPIMDFSLKVGDEIELYATEGEDEIRRVIAVSDTILDCSTDRRQRHCVYVMYHGERDCWVEGIGSLKYGIRGVRSEWGGGFIRLLNVTSDNDTLYACVTPQNPKDMTSKIVNPRFDNNDVKTGWGGSGFPNGYSQENAEQWNSTYNVCQKIVELPKGVYAVGVKAFYRAGALLPAYQHYKNQDEDARSAQLYANGCVEMAVNLQSIFDPERTERLGESGEEEVIDEETGKHIWVPNTVTMAERYMHELHLYDNCVLAIVNDSLTIGVRNDNYHGGDWSVFDDFSLAYYGDGPDASQLFLDEARKPYDSFTIAEGTLYTESYLNAARQYWAVHHVEAALSTLDYIKNAYAMLQKNIDLWKKWQTVMARGRSVAVLPQFADMQQARQLAYHCGTEATRIEKVHNLTNEQLEADIHDTEALMSALYDVEGSYNRMLKEGKQWEYEHHVWNYDHTVTKVIYTLTGDTIINGKSYYKLYRQEEDGKPEYKAALREEGGTVYGYWWNPEVEVRTIDFDPYFFSEETMDFYSQGDDVREEIDSISVKGRAFVRHKYWLNGVGPIIAVEGVGYEENGILGMYFGSFMSDYLRFVACYEDGECIFDASDFNKPGIDTEIKVVESNRHTGTNIFYDLQGRRIQGEPQHGVYIRNGKKVMR